MSTASNRTSRPQRGSTTASLLSKRRSIGAPREVRFDDGYGYALRIAYLHYLLQPRKKRKEYVAAPKPVRAHTHSGSVGELMKEFMPSSSSSSSNMKLPHNFHTALEKRMERVMTGHEKLPGYNDAAVKRTFGEAYTAFTANSFRKSVSIDRKIEPLILIFYTSANKAQGRGKAADDDAWKPLVDRHVALFVRLVSSLLRDLGSDQSRPELMRRLADLEKKLLTNDQDLYSDSSSGGANMTIEVEIPLTHEVKDMPMVQTVSRIFGRTLSDVQTDIDRGMSDWNEEAALRDLKTYQHHLTSDMPGALRRQDFDLDVAYDEWKKAEIHQITQMMLDLLRVRPDLSKSSTANAGGHARHGSLVDKSLPPRPQSFYAADGSGGGSPSGYDAPVDMSMLSIQDGNGAAEGPPEYAFIPPDPRAYYKFVLKHALSHDQLNPDEAGLVSEAVPLRRATLDLLVELAVQWRLAQVSRCILLLDVAAQKYLDLELRAEEVYEIFEDVKERASFDHLPHNKKPPHVQSFGKALQDLDSSRWPSHEYAAYQQILIKTQDAMLRELLEVAAQGYEAKPPSIGPTLLFLTNHVHADRAFPQRPEVVAQFAEALTAQLRERAAGVYRNLLDTHIPQQQEDWDFSHVVALGRAVVALCERTRKRYRKTPTILGVSPFTELVTTVFPNLEQDAKAIIERVIFMAKERGLEVNMQDGFDLYKELADIRKIHVESLPGQPFAFHLEGLLEEFVWRWIRGAQVRMETIAEEAIKLDTFRVRTSHPDDVPTDEERHSVSILDLFQAFNQSVDQIHKLEWDDEVHHAKFMTALSKAFAAGIGRYCEIAEKLFAKEMDRPSAQELADSAKSAQERWMKYAKDALSSKDKVEPFQFYPESFVKLNNIEYAMQALDKLSKAVNVDGCAEVLERVNGPPKPVDRRNAKYLFTIKIVEAEDLKACDPTGTSDPYVVLGDEYQKRLAKTRIIMRDLNPRWDESVEITVSGPLNIIATIWDYDTFGDHDFVGRTSLKLDPLHFSDYLPREFWLDLDTQGRLLLRVSMEGLREDDIRFHFGKAFRHLKRTERDMVRKITDKLRAHINASLSHDALKSLMSRGTGASAALSSVVSLWNKRSASAAGAGAGGAGGDGSGGGGGAGAAGVSRMATMTALQPLFTYFDENFRIMNQTLTEATMLAVMTRLWKEVLMALEALLVPPLSEKPSQQRPLTQAELDVVFQWLQLLLEFFNARDDASGEALGVPLDVLKSPKYHELASLNFFYFEPTESLIRTSERMAAETAQRAQRQLQEERQLATAAGGTPLSANRHLSLPALGGPGGGTGGAGAFASMGTIRRGTSILMSRNLGTMRRAKEEKRREAQADPSDDMILRILRMRPEAAQYLKERHRQKARMATHQAAAMIVRQSIAQGWTGGPAFGGATYSRTTNLPQR